MIKELIDALNGCLDGISEGQKLYGIAQSIYRHNSDDSIDFMPGVIEDDGEAKYIGIDDIYTVQMYHRVNTATLSVLNRSGYGDSWENQDVFNFGFVSAWDTRKLKIQSPDMLMILRARFPQQMKGPQDVKQIIITPSNSILNSKQIFETEYSIGKSDLLPAYINFVQINYSIQIKYDPKCIAKCINC